MGNSYIHLYHQQEIEKGRVEFAAYALNGTKLNNIDNFSDVCYTLKELEEMIRELKKDYPDNPIKLKIPIIDLLGDFFALEVTNNNPLEIKIYTEFEKVSIYRVPHANEIPESVRDLVS